MATVDPVDDTTFGETVHECENRLPSQPGLPPRQTNRSPSAPGLESGLQPLRHFHQLLIGELALGGIAHVVAMTAPAITALCDMPLEVELRVYRELFLRPRYYFLILSWR